MRDFKPGGRRRSFDDVFEELSQHLKDRYDELRAGGMNDDAARRAALAEFEHSERLVPATPPPPSDAPARSVWAALRQDVRYAVRTLLKTPAFTAVVVLTLALGIGATTAIFSVVDGVMLRPLPYPDVERIVSISERTTHGDGMSVSWPNYQDWAAQNDVFERLGIYRAAAITLTGGDRPERINAAYASADVFGATGIPAAAGRVFAPENDRQETDRVAVISDRLWRTRFNADPAAVGRTVALNGESYTVIGVMPPSMRFPSRLTDAWLPLGLIVPTFPPRGAHPGLLVIGKLKAGVTFERADAAMDAIARRLEAQYPQSNRNTRVAMQKYYEQVVQNIRPALVILLAAVGFVLLMACANLANLMLSRAEGRHREIAIRAALGASRRRIVQQLLVESLLLAGSGGAAGALLASWTVKAFVASQPSSVPRVDLIAVDGRVLIFAALVSIAAGIVFGLGPAWRASRPDLLVALKDAAHSTTGSRRFRSTLVVAEIALAMILLVGAGLTVRSFARLMAVDPGFDPDRVVTLRLNLAPAKYPDRERWTVFHRELLRRIRAVAGVESAAINSTVPLEGGGAEAPILKEGDPMPSPDRPAPATLFQTTSPGYFGTMGIALLKGRDFDARDTVSAPLVAIIDETAVQKIFHGEEAIGKRIAFEIAGAHGAGGQPIWREVVGVVRHVRHYGLVAEPPYVQVYTPFEQLPLYMQQRLPAMALMVKTPSTPETIAASLRRELAGIDADIPVYQVQTMGRYLDQNTEQPRLSVLVLTAFGGLALLLAVVGIYGVLSYTVSQRRQEIGIRMALGASRRDVLRLVVGHGMALTAIGGALGLAGAWTITASLQTLLFGISPHDAATYVGISTALIAAALAASYVPGRRAARVDPATALRAE